MVLMGLYICSEPCTVDCHPFLTRNDSQIVLTGSSLLRESYTKKNCLEPNSTPKQQKQLKHFLFIVLHHILATKPTQSSAIWKGASITKTVDILERKKTTKHDNHSLTS